jgi:AraC-like DNA-binding protein
MAPTRDEVLAAAQRVGERPTQAAVARELGISRHQLVRLITPEELRTAVGAVVPPAEVSSEDMLQAAETLAHRSGFDSVTHSSIGAFFGRSEKWAEKRIRMPAVWTRLKARGFVGSRKTADERRAQIREAARGLGFTGLTHQVLAKACGCSDVLIRSYFPDLSVLGDSPVTVSGTERRQQIIDAARKLHAEGVRITSGRVGREIEVAGSTVRYHFPDMSELVKLAE